MRIEPLKKKVLVLEQKASKDDFMIYLAQEGRVFTDSNLQNEIKLSKAEYDQFLKKHFVIVLKKRKESQC